MLKLSFKEMKIYNATIKKEDRHLTNFQAIPNGIYKFKVKYYDDEDDNLSEWTVFYEVKIHFNSINI